MVDEFLVPNKPNLLLIKYSALQENVQLRSQQSSHFYGNESSTEVERDEESIKGMVGKTNLRMESSVHKVGEILGRASKKIYKAFVRSEAEMKMEMRKTKDGINNMVKKFYARDESLAKCLSNYKADLEAVRAAVLASIIYCTERAMKKFEITRTEGETAAKKVAAFDATLVENILENCARDSGGFFTRNQKMKIRKRFYALIILLNEIPKNAEAKTTEIARETIECHPRTQGIAIEGFRLISKDAIRWFAKKEKEPKTVSMWNGNRNDTTRIFEDNKNDGKERVKICGEKARAETKMVIDMLRQDLISCNSYLFRITRPSQDLNSKQYMLLKSQEILVYLRGVSDSCAKVEDFLAHAKNEIPNLESKLNYLQETVNMKFSHVPNILEKSVPFEKCWRGSVRNAVERLKIVEKNCKINTEK